jgi:hypothetical protein
MKKAKNDVHHVNFWRVGKGGTISFSFFLSFICGHLKLSCY